MEKIKKFLDKMDTISLSRFINMCLYHKEYGYYQKNKIGNDFITSPEVSQMFGECIAFFFILLTKKIELTNIFELGPGNGTLASDISRSLEKLTNQKINYFLHEKSNLLRLDQFQYLKKIFISKSNKFRIEKKPTFFVCNEFFDALPFNQIKKIKDKFYEKRIIYKNKKFSEVFRNYELNSDFDYDDIKENDIIEYSPNMDLYLKKIFKHIRNYGGGVLIFDYGPFIKKRVETIQAIYKKRKCGILDFPFESDITYHIDFKRIMMISKKYKLQFYGPIFQKKFLYYNGINERLDLLLKYTSSSYMKNKLNEQFIRLTDPEGMGNLIKCIFVSKKKLTLNAFNT